MRSSANCNRSGRPVLKPCSHTPDTVSSDRTAAKAVQGPTPVTGFSCPVVAICRLKEHIEDRGAVHAMFSEHHQKHQWSVHRKVDASDAIVCPLQPMYTYLNIQLGCIAALWLQENLV